MRVGKRLEAFAQLGAIKVRCGVSEPMANVADVEAGCRGIIHQQGSHRFAFKTAHAAHLGNPLPA